MPKKGWKSVTISIEFHQKALDYMNEVNKVNGFKKIRSLPHLVELAMTEYMKAHSTSVK